MKSELPPETLVKNRYLIKKLLGQEEFGRTYLVIDTQNNHEKCILQEFVVNNKNQEAVKKLLELFQQEPEIFQKLEHPQIPKFLDVFELDGRLFFVEKYIEDKTYIQQHFNSVTEIIEVVKSLLKSHTQIQSPTVVTGAEKHQSNSIAPTELSADVSGNNETQISGIQEKTPVKPVKNRNQKTYYKVLAAIATLFLLGNVSIAVISTFITPICNLLNNCDKDQEYEKNYIEGRKQADTALNLAISAKNISELELSSKQLKDAINQLNNIPQSATLYQKSIQLLSSYKNELISIEERINKEKTAEKQFNDIENKAANIVLESTNRDLISKLRNYQASLQGIKKELESIPPDVFIAEKVESKLQQYDKKIENIDNQIKRMKNK